MLQVKGSVEYIQSPERENLRTCNPARKIIRNIKTDQKISQASKKMTEYSNTKRLKEILKDLFLNRKQGRPIEGKCGWRMIT